LILLILHLIYIYINKTHFCNGVVSIEQDDNGDNTDVEEEGEMGREGDMDDNGDIGCLLF
jgi:hypothetical protein